MDAEVPKEFHEASPTSSSHNELVATNVLGSIEGAGRKMEVYRPSDGLDSESPLLQPRYSQEAEMYEWKMEKDDHFNIRQSGLANNKRCPGYQALNVASISPSLKVPESRGLCNIASLTAKFWEGKHALLSILEHDNALQLIGYLD
ncbi:uncharacterized protein ARMOST_06107 [Armillaria ostoyae]|uniref:Uncharacterized protein n=1 Tax=Armillaria ostoyae TaxID=47428 RepID=A0A284R214_ARMOS|nr:uncharacterized protein ARMOST_06107 [Armillaria ostoyae]